MPYDLQQICQWPSWYCVLRRYLGIYTHSICTNIDMWLSISSSQFCENLYVGMRQNMQAAFWQLASMCQLVPRPLSALGRLIRLIAPLSVPGGAHPRARSWFLRLNCHPSNLARPTGSAKAPHLLTRDSTSASTQHQSSTDDHAHLLSMRTPGHRLYASHHQFSLPSAR